MHFYWESYGCSANQADMERIIGILESMGISQTSDPKRSDLIILNTCAVKLTTENRMISRYRELSSFKKPIIVTGCLPRMNLKRCKKECLGFSALIDPNSIPYLKDIVDRVLSGEKGIIKFSEPSTNIFHLPKVSIHPVIHIIPISFGCLGNCAFCGVKNVRRRLVSVPIRDVIMDFESALKSGKKEIWLTSQDDAIYGWDIGFTLNDLLSALTEIPGDFRVRIGMMNPGGAMKLVPDLIGHFKDPRIYKFVHIPVQTGSARILKRMKRQHSVDDFVKLVSMFRSEIPGVTISTDIIVGFPGETEEDFRETLNLVNKTRPDIVNISKFYPRPGTEAARMKKVPTDVISDRTRRLSEVVKRISYESNRKMVGKVETVLVSDEKKKVGRTSNYKQVFIDGDVELGSFYSVEIVDAGPRSLRGKLLNQ